MRIKQLILGTLLAFAAVFANAHRDGHDEAQPIDRAQAAARADTMVPMLIKDKKLHPSWGKRERKGVRSLDIGKVRVWVVSYHNPAEKDAKKRDLYVFVDELGNFIGMNHTGKP